MQKFLKNTFNYLSATIIAVSLSIFSGCESLPGFPDHASHIQQAADGDIMLGYDTSGDSRIDYEQALDSQGRVSQLHYLTSCDQADMTINLADIDRSDVPHFIIALDGVPYELVEQLYDSGAFRLFSRPSKMVSCFPSMTDLVFSRLFDGAQPLAYEAEYYNSQTNRIMPGNDVYLSGENADWIHQLSYRSSLVEDAIAYVTPGYIFGVEMKGMNNTFTDIDHGQAIAYMVSTAALGTRGGREAIIDYLLKVDRYCQRLVHQRRGRVMITLLADHGHTMRACTRLDFRDRLEAGGYRVAKRLDSPDDVIIITYGLVTYAALNTADPAGVASVLLGDPRVDLATWPKDSCVMVADVSGRARIERDGSRYRYTIETGDPLGYESIVNQLRSQGAVDENGWIEDDLLLAATVDTEYPDAIKRLWQAFNGLVRYPADLLVSLNDGWCNGSKGFEAAIGRPASTHGSLNYVNSMTFVMTMWGDLPEVMRPEQVMPALEQLSGGAASNQ